MSNPLMNNNPGAWLGGQAQAPAQESVVSPELRKLYTMYQASSDPKGFINQVMSSNPMLKARGEGKGGMKEQFYAECQRRGINPDTFLAQVEQDLKKR